MDLGLVIIVIVIFLIFIIGVVNEHTPQKVKPNNFLTMTGNYSGNEKKYVSEAKELLDGTKDERVKIFLNGLINFYDKNNAEENTIIGADLNE